MGHNQEVKNIGRNLDKSIGTATICGKYGIWTSYCTSNSAKSASLIPFSIQCIKDSKKKKSCDDIMAWGLQNDTRLLCCSARSKVFPGPPVELQCLCEFSSNADVILMMQVFKSSGWWFVGTQGISENPRGRTWCSSAENPSHCKN